MVDDPVAPARTARERSLARALDNPNRKRVLELLDTRDYATTTDLLNHTSLGWGTLLYHLDLLMRADLVGTQLAGKRRVYYRRRPGLPDQLAVEAKMSPNLGRIVEAVLAKTGRTQQEFTEATGLSQRMCSYYLQKLAERGLIVREPDGNRARYHATPRLLEAFAQAPAPRAP